MPSVCSVAIHPQMKTAVVNGPKGKRGQPDLLFQPAHYCVGHADLHSQTFDFGLRRLVLNVEDEDVGEIGIEPRDLRRRDFHAEIGEHFVGGAFERCAADNRADSHHRRFRAFEQTAYTGHGKDRADADQRVAGAYDDGVGTQDGFGDSGGGFRRFDVFETDAGDLRLGATFDQVFLKMHLAFGGDDRRGRVGVGHRQDARFDAERRSQPFGDLRKRASLSQLLRAENVSGQVAVAQVEPAFGLRVAEELFETVKGVAGQSPAGFWVDSPGQRVGNDVQVGRDVEPEHLYVVARVDDDQYLFGRRDPAQPVEEF